MVQTRRKKAAAAQDGAVKENKAEPPAPQTQTPVKRARRGRPPKIRPEANAPSTSGPTDVSNLSKKEELNSSRNAKDCESQESSESLLTNEADSFLDKEDEEDEYPPQPSTRKEQTSVERPKTAAVPPPPPMAKRRSTTKIKIKDEPVEKRPEAVPVVEPEEASSKLVLGSSPAHPDDPQPSTSANAFVPMKPKLELEPEEPESQENAAEYSTSTAFSPVFNEEDSLKKLDSMRLESHDAEPESLKFPAASSASSQNDSESMDIADSDSEMGAEQTADPEEATTPTAASATSSVSSDHIPALNVKHLVSEIRVDVDQCSSNKQTPLPSWERKEHKPPVTPLGSPDMQRPRIHFLHPAFNSFSSESLTSPQPPPPPEPHTPLRDTENGVSLRFKPMSIKSVKMGFGLKSNPLFKANALEPPLPPTPAPPSEPSAPAPVPPPALLSNSAASLAPPSTQVSPMMPSPVKRSTNFGGSTSNALPPPQMVELPQLSFFNVPNSNSVFAADDSPQEEHHERARTTYTPPLPGGYTDATIQALKARVGKVAEEIERRHDEDRQKEEKEEQERRREERERRYRKLEEERVEQSRQRQREEDERRLREREREFAKRHEREELKREEERIQTERKQKEEDERKEKEEERRMEEEKKIKVEDMKVPEYELISENKFLMKNANKKKTESLVCDCFQNNGNCSDTSCVNRAMLTECPSSCPVKCKNQRFAKKKYAAVEAFHTGTGKGCGLRALKDIKKGRFIIEYVGEVVERDDYEKRKKKYAADKAHKHHYLCDTGTYTIDATVYGNQSRFVNHSCDPNAICERWSVPRTPGDVNRVGFFAKKNIKAGEEITFDYQFENYGRDAQQCFCGATTCTGWIGRKPEGFSSDEDDDDEDIITTRQINMDEEEEEKLEELQGLEPHERINLINDLLADMVIRNKKYARKVITVAAKMTDHTQRENLLKDIFSADTSLGTQTYYAKEGMATLMGEWLFADDYSLANLKLVQTTLQTLLSDVFVACAKSDPFLLEMSRRWHNVTLGQWVDFHVVVDSLLTCVEDPGRNYKEVQEASNNEIVANFTRVKEMAFRLEHHWFNRSVSFRIPKKVRAPEPKESDQKHPSSGNPDIIRDASPPYQRHHHSSYYERETHPRFFNNGNDVHQYRRPSTYRDSYRDRRRFNRRSRSRSRSFSPPTYKRRRVDDRESRYRSPPYERRPATPEEKTPESSVSVERHHPKSESKSNPANSTTSNAMTVDAEVRGPSTPQAPSSQSYPTPHEHPSHAVAAVPCVPSVPAAAVPANPYAMPGYEAYGMYDPNTGMYVYHAAPPGYYPHAYPAHHPHMLTMEMLPSNERLNEVYERATLEQLTERLERAKCDVDMLQKHVAKKRAAAEALEAARRRAEEEAKQQAEAASKYVWARAKADTGETYYYNKLTKETQWTPPTNDQGLLEPGDCASPDTTVPAEEPQQQRQQQTPQQQQPQQLAQQLQSVDREVAQKKQASESADEHTRTEDHASSHKSHRERDRDRDRREESRHRDQSHHHSSHRTGESSTERRIREFKKELERVICSVVKSYMRQLRDATADKIQWLIKLVVKEMYKRESAQNGFDHRITDNTEKKVRNYTKSLIDRKLKSDDLWKGYAEQQQR
ncbi:unnamed protein product [Caenorhabditis sp. 36 PRJEB53466]|nr:unnamed protein product [Caenorhabditis sp. 36 PRJEB53466]